MIKLLVQLHLLRKLSYPPEHYEPFIQRLSGRKVRSCCALKLWGGSIASLECFVGQLMKVLLVAMGEMAAAAEAHRLNDLAYAIEALVLALFGVDQQLPHPIQADGALQFEWCALEVFFGSLEQRCS